MMRSSISIAAALCLVLSVVWTTSALPKAFTPFAGWVHVGKSDSEKQVMVSFALKQRNLNKLLEIVETVSNPRSSQYTNYLTREELKDLISPNPKSVFAVTQYLESTGISGYTLSPNSDFIRVKMTIKQVEQHFNVEMNAFQSLDDPRFVIHRTLDTIDVHPSIVPHVDVIYGLRAFPIVKSLAQRVTAGPLVTPSVLKSLYKITDSYSGTGNSSQALAEWQSQYYSVSDLSSFLSHFQLPDQKIRNVYGTNQPNTPGIEANLDVQYILATGTGIPTDFYIHDGEAFDLIGWITTAEGIPASKAPLVWSVSYGENIKSVSVDEATRLDVEFQKLGAIGVSVIIASGDSGVYSRGEIGIQFDASYPAVLPHATAVGATFLNNDNTETECTNWSGGGFSPSKYFTRAGNATYQSDAVAAYFSSGVDLPPANLYDRFGRGIPDVSALGLNFQIYDNNEIVSVAGTSASTPSFAGVISLLNDQRSLQGKKPLGFLNPFLYQNSAAFNDIKLGKNNDGKLYGFNAYAGWDPASGLGTPVYTLLKAAAIAAP